MKKLWKKKEELDKFEITSSLFNKDLPKSKLARRCKCKKDKRKLNQTENKD